MEFKGEIEKNKKKQIIISAIYVTLFLFVLTFIYYAVKPNPSCFDGKRNQNEEKVDCGGICAKKCALISEENIQVEKTGFVASGLVDKYDIYGEIVNPNNLLGSNYFDYEFKVKNSAGQIIAEKKGNNFILPGERKNIIELNVDMKESPASVELVANNAKWVEFNPGNYQKPEIKVVNKVYNEISGGSGFSEAKALIKNESQFDFTTIKAYVILRGVTGEILALNSTSMNTVKAGENRDFRIFWPNRFPGEVRNVDVQIDVNVFDSESFLKRYFQTEEFQKF